ncbi:hypothetical protein [Nocardia sp. NPDC051570]|uniref:hypothetical protein n=1 Tax=Nocardia sp. NPDC051570 TaxID=3364324 RepID=UPI0037B63607
MARREHLAAHRFPARERGAAARVELPLLTGVRHSDVVGAVTDDIVKWVADKTMTVGPGVLDATVNVPFPGR